MTVPTFGVTYSQLHQHHFAQLAGFSAETSPAAATVTEMVDEAAADVCGALVTAGVTPENITSGTVAYSRCAKAVRMGAAAAVMRVMPGADPKAAADMQSAFEAWLKKAEEKGAAFLGDESLDGAGPPPRGPSSHISRFSLTVDDEAANASSVAPRLRMDDEL